MTNSKLKTISIFTFLAGIIVGSIGHYIYIYSAKNNNQSKEAAETLSAILPFYEYEVKEENYSCEGKHRNVGSILTGIIGSNIGHKVNALSAGCHQGHCTVTFNYCKTWQSMECGSRMLIFQKNSHGKVVPETFQCIDMP